MDGPATILFQDALIKSAQTALALLLLLIALIVVTRVLIPRFIRQRLHFRHLTIPLVPLRGVGRLLSLTPRREHQLPVKQIVLQNFPLTPLEFLAVMENAIGQRNIPGLEMSLITRRESGVLSPRRRYLHFTYHTSVGIVGAIPIGPSLAIAWRIGEIASWAAVVLREYPRLHNLIDWFIRPPTFYQTDVNLAFQELTRQIIVDAIDQTTQVRGFRPLTQVERQQILQRMG